MSAGLEDHRAERQRPHVVPAARRAEGEPGVVRVLLGPVEGGVEPRAEGGVLEGVAGELAVGAVQYEGEEEEQPGGDEAARVPVAAQPAAISAVTSEAVVTWLGVRPRRAHQRARYRE